MVGTGSLSQELELYGRLERMVISELDLQNEDSIVSPRAWNSGPDWLRNLQIWCKGLGDLSLGEVFPGLRSDHLALRLSYLPPYQDDLLEQID